MLQEQQQQQQRREQEVQTLNNYTGRLPKKEQRRKQMSSKWRVTCKAACAKKDNMGPLSADVQEERSSGDCCCCTNKSCWSSGEVMRKYRTTKGGNRLIRNRNTCCRQCCKQNASCGSREMITECRTYKRGNRASSSNGICCCCCEQTTSCSSGERISKYGRNKEVKSRICGNSRRSFPPTYDMYKSGTAVGVLFLVAVLLLFLPQVYMFPLFRRTKKAEEAEQPKEETDLRLSSQSTILLSATPAQVELLRHGLILPVANVTTQEVAIHPVGSVDKEMEEYLTTRNIFGRKDLRITVVFMDEQVVPLENSPTDKGAICKEGQRAMLVSLGYVGKNDENKMLAQLHLHSPSQPRFSKVIPGFFSLESLDPVAWGNNRVPSAEERDNFHGTAICLRPGTPLQLIQGWPMRVPDYKDGPWQARVKVVRAFVTASAKEKEKKLLLQAVLQILREPTDGIFNEQNLTTIPFMGYVKADATRQTHLAGALIRHQLLHKACTLRREKEKSQVELLCEDIEATLADLNEMVQERPMLREVFKKTGLLAGVSAGSFGLAVGTYLLGSINKSLEFLDIKSCLWVGAAAGILSLLHMAIAGPIAALKRVKWREKFGLEKRKFLQQVVKEEKDLSSSPAAVVDLVLVVNELEHASHEAPDPGEFGIDPEILPDPSLLKDPAEASPLLAKVQSFVSRYIYLDTVRSALDRCVEKGFSQFFAKRKEEEERELTRLRDFLRKAAKLNSQLLTMTEFDEFLFTAQQKRQAYTYLGQQLQQELDRDLSGTEKPFMAVEALYSKYKTDCMQKKMRQLYNDVKNAGGGGELLPLDSVAPRIKSWKKRLQQVKDSEEYITAEISRLSGETEEKEGAAEELKEREERKKELERAKVAVKEATDTIFLELRVLLENDLQLALEEADNLKESLTSLKKAAGDQPSPQQETEMEDIVSKLKEIKKTVISLVYDMRTMGMDIDVVREVPIEVDTDNEEGDE